MAEITFYPPSTEMWAILIGTLAVVTIYFWVVRKNGGKTQEENAPATTQNPNP